MQYRFSISAFKRPTIWIAVFLLPVLAFELFGLPSAASDRHWRQIFFQEEKRLESPGKKIWIVGDSSVMFPLEHARKLGEFPELYNFGATASTAMEWRFILESLLRKHPRPDAIVVATAKPSLFFVNFNFSASAAYFASWGGILDLARGGEVSMENLLTLSAHKIFSVLRMGRQLHAEIFKGWIPGFLELQQEIWARAGLSGGAAQEGESVSNFNTISDLQKSGVKVFFVLMPASQRERDFYRGTKSFAVFDLLKDTGQPIADFSDAYPDSAFVNDGAHLREEYSLELCKRIAELVRAQ